MKIIYNKYIPFGKYNAINLFEVVFAKNKLTAQSENHEYIHTLQMRELLYVFFYLWYGLEWLIRLIQYKSLYKAYKNISFEREAYTNDYEPSYPSYRHRFAFIRYL